MKLTEAQFLKEVATHEMTVLRDDGVHRHLSFRRPGTYCMGFDIVTWPGYLAYTGDMGCYVFSRLPDMFEFFRADRLHGDGKRKLHTNESYWSEKVVGMDPGGVQAFCPDLFIKRVNERLADVIENHGGRAPAGLRNAIKEQVFGCVDDGEHAAMSALNDFEYEGISFNDVWEMTSRAYTHRFEWCCYALAWSILRYDEAKVPA